MASKILYNISMPLFAALSDIHQLPVAPPEPVDCLLFAGDALQGYLIDEDFDYHKQLIYQYQALPQFVNWLSLTSADEVIMISGNHDYLFELLGAATTEYVLNNMLQQYSYPTPQITVLDNSLTTFAGKTIWGTAYCSMNPEQSKPFSSAYLLTEEQYLLTSLPVADIILSHLPPELPSAKPVDSLKAAKHLKAEIMRVKPQVVVAGHYHWLRGEYQIEDSKIIIPSVAQEYRKDVPGVHAIQEDPYIYFEL